MNATHAAQADRAVRLRIRSVQYDYRASLSEKIEEMRKKAEEALAVMEKSGVMPEEPCSEDEMLYDEKLCGDAGEPFQMVTEGRFRMRGNLCEISYEESELTGMNGTRTSLVFSKNRPEVVTLTRTDEAKMTLSFEQGRHHVGDYKMPMLQMILGIEGPMPIASFARKVENRIFENGTLMLDYIIEVRGLDTQRTIFSLVMEELPPVPPALNGI